MPTTCKSTVRYAAKSAYQLALMVARYSSTQCGMYCLVYPNLGYVTVHGIELGDGNFAVRNVPIAEAWANL